MTPGSDYIYKCPNCDKLFRRGSFSSGNSFFAKLFSDGVCVAPMLPNFPNLTRCSCGAFLNFRELKEIGVAKFNYHSETGYEPIIWKNLSLKVKYMLLKRDDNTHIFSKSGFISLCFLGDKTVFPLILPKHLIKTFFQTVFPVWYLYAVNRFDAGFV